MADHTNDIDKQVGRRVRALRDTARVSIQEAALLVGSKLDDYRKLESGELRFKARQLMDLARRFRVNGSAFFDELELPEPHGRQRETGVSAPNVLH